MPVKINLTNKDFVKILLNYDFGELKKSRFFTSGSVQTNVFFQTAKDRLVLRYYQNRSKNSISFEVNLLNYLKRHGYPCPAPLKNKKGKFISVYKGRHFVIFEFLEGSHIKKPGNKQKAQLVQKVAELQNVLKRYHPVNKRYRWNYSIELCQSLARKAARKINTADAKEKLKWLISETNKLQLPKSLPKGICHCDFHFANILFKDGKFNALIDFDDANFTYRIFDLVCLIEPFKFYWNNWAKFKISRGVFDFKRSKQIVSEYLKSRPLAESEKKHLFDVYKLSIFIDCVWYFGRGRAQDFYERRKIDCLNDLGREEFYKRIFG